MHFRIIPLINRNRQCSCQAESISAQHIWGGNKRSTACKWRPLESVLYLRATGNLDYVCFPLIYLSCLVERCNAVLLWSSRNVLWAYETSPDDPSAWEWVDNDCVFIFWRNLFKHSLTDLLLSNTLIPFFFTMYYIFLPLLFKMFPLFFFFASSRFKCTCFKSLYRAVPWVFVFMSSSCRWQNSTRLRCTGRRSGSGSQPGAAGVPWTPLIFVILPVWMESLSSSCVDAEVSLYSTAIIWTPLDPLVLFFRFFIWIKASGHTIIRLYMWPSDVFC